VRYLVLDLETVLDTTLPPPKKKSDGSDAFPPAPYHRIVVMAVGLLDARYQLRRLWVVGEDDDKDERGTLTALANFLGEQRDMTVVSYNGRGFDLPVIAARCLRHGVSFPWYYRQRDARHRYSTGGHFDVMDYLVDHGATRSYSLDVAAKLIGMPGKMACTGGDVQAMIDAGQIEAVRGYCMSDVAQTTALFLRTQLLRGELDAAACAQAMGVLLATIASEPRLAPMLPLIDRERLVPRLETVPFQNDPRRLQREVDTAIV
jgi:predicted PolB exonuclease-like 3'-5' exonuclease